MLDDLRYAFRTLAKNPGFTAVAVCTIALAIGANISVFSLVNAVLLRPLAGVAEPDRIVSLARMFKANSFGNLDYPDYADYRDANQSFSGIAAHFARRLNFNLQGAERVSGDLVTPNYFDVLGVRPALGDLRVDDHSDSAVISDALWQRKFGGAANVIGARIALNGSMFTITGVASRGFRGTFVNEFYDVWIPLSAQPQVIADLSPSIAQDRAAGWVDVFARRKPGVSIGQAQAEMTALSSRLALSHPETKPVVLAGNFGMYQDDRAEVSRLLALLSSSVALLLLIACANVAGLFLARATGRTREIAVRLAVGASRARIARQLVIEGLALSVLAGVIGLLLSQWTAAGVVSITDRVPLLRAVDISVDGRVLLFTLAAALLAGALFAAAPALESFKIDLTGSLKAGLPGSGRRRTRLRSALVTGQVALSFVLLSASAMLLRDFYRLVHANPGFETARAVVFSVDVAGLHYSPDRAQAFYRRLIERIETVPGVVSASVATIVPPNDLSSRVSIFYPGEEPSPQVLHAQEFNLGLRVDLNAVGPRYFETLGISLLSGREFTARDRGVAIVGRRLADRLWPGENPIGKRISWPAWGAVNGSETPRPPLEIVGVAADVRNRSLLAEPALLMYVPDADNDNGRVKVIVRTASDPRSSVAAVLRAAGEADPDVPVFNAETMAEHAAASLWQQRTAADWIAAFSLMAMALAALGLYSVVAQSVAQRTREVGIRIALGARPRAVSRLIVGEGMRLAAIGFAIGVPAALGFEQFFRSLLPGLGDRDPAGFVLIALLLTVVLLIACWVPARRAAGVDPIEALRCD